MFQFLSYRSDLAGFASSAIQVLPPVQYWCFMPAAADMINVDSSFCPAGGLARVNGPSI